MAGCHVPPALMKQETMNDLLKDTSANILLREEEARNCGHS